jgi:hypothetical protein
VPDSSVIADVSTTLQSVLTDAFSTLLPAPTPVAEIHDLLGPISTSPARMTIFLFEVIEDATLRNRHPRRIDNAPGVEFIKAPIPLVLKYLLTPWGGDPLTDHRIMGRALQVLHDDAVLSGPQLRGSLSGTSEAIKLKLAPLTLEEQTRVWYSVQRPYRFSVTYDVRVINIDAQKRKVSSPVRSRTIDSAIGGTGP